MISYLMSILSLHYGQDRAISADCLFRDLRAAGYDVPGLPALRGLIHDARQQGRLIGSCDKGYFLPVSLDEALHYIEHRFLTPARDELRTARLQRRKALESFGPQMRLL